MPDPDRPSPRAGGAVIAIAVMIGAAIGGIARQPSIGVLAGTGVGVLAAIAIWLSDRKRAG